RPPPRRWPTPGGVVRCEGGALFALGEISAIVHIIRLTTEGVPKHETTGRPDVPGPSEQGLRACPRERRPSHSAQGGRGSPLPRDAALPGAPPDRGRSRCG